MPKQREIVLTPGVMLPATSTASPEQPMSMLEFLEQMVLTSPKIKEPNNLPYLFELEDRLAQVKTEATEKSGSKLPVNIIQPTQPGPSATPEEIKQYQAKLQAVLESAQLVAREHWRAVYDASVGMKFVLSEDAFTVSLDSIKSHLDNLARPNPANEGMPSIDPFVERKVLRLYHAYSQSKEISQ